MSHNTTMRKKMCVEMVVEEDLLTVRHKIENFNEPISAFEIHQFEVTSELMLHYGSYPNEGEVVEKWFERIKQREEV